MSISVYLTSLSPKLGDSSSLLYLASLLLQPASLVLCFCETPNEQRIIPLIALGEILPTPENVRIFAVATTVGYLVVCAAFRPVATLCNGFFLFGLANDQNTRTKLE